MKLENFSAGRYEQATGYKYFVPEKINMQWSWEDGEINFLIEKASSGLGSLNSFSQLVPDIDLFLWLYLTREAVVSSRIEGTRTRFDEALLPIEEITPEKRDNWREVRNYIEATNHAIKQLQNLPLSTRLIKEAHKILLSGVRGKHRNPGEFRKSQNWIGGLTLRDAIFIPPSHIYINELMNDLENFLHNKNIQVPHLIKIAMAHYQFETIHPFLDGNGRIGRLIIILYFIEQNILNKPLLALSVFFEKNKIFYYDSLTDVREKNNMIKWIKYFLNGIIDTTGEASRILSRIIELKSKLEEQILNKAGRRTNSAQTLLNHIFSNPVVKVKNVKDICRLSSKSANDLVKFFTKSGILKEISGRTRNRIYIFDEYIHVFE